MLIRTEKQEALLLKLLLNILRTLDNNSDPSSLVKFVLHLSTQLFPVTEKGKAATPQYCSLSL